MDMMNAYLPGFDMIGREKVMEWMFGLASRLITSDKEKSLYKEDGYSHKLAESLEEISKTDISYPDKNEDRKFPSYEYSEDSDFKNDAVSKTFLVQTIECNMNTVNSNNVNSKNSEVDDVSYFESNSHPIPSETSPLSSSLIQSLSSSPTEKSNQSRSKRKGRQLSCSSQESTDEKVDQLTSEEESCLRTLLEMFPGACTMEARHCLKLSFGDMDKAAQLIMDRQETGQAIIDRKASVLKSHKFKKVMDYKLDDDSIKSCVLKKYSFVDTEEDKKTFRPQPPKVEAKKLVRYRDGQVVSMKGEKFSEVSKKEDDSVKATYVNLKPARKYRFH